MFLFRVRKTLRTHVGDLDVAAVACGLGRAIGNKVNFVKTLTDDTVKLELNCLSGEC